MIAKLFARKRVRRLIGLLAADALLFAGTNVAQVPSFVVMVGFLLLAATLYYLIYGLVSLPGWYGLPVKGRRRLTLYMTAITAGLVALQSIGELSSRDVMVLMPLAALGYLYSAYAKTTRRNLST